MTIQSRILHKWKDSRLKWDPEHYEGIHSINIPSEQIWTPTIYLNGSRYDHELASCQPVKCIVVYDSGIACTFPCHQSVACKGNSRDWPFDEQNCSFVFEAGTHEYDVSFDLNMVKAEMSNDSSNYWEMIEGKIKANTKYPNQLTFTFLLRRVFSSIFKRVVIPGYVLITLTLVVLLMKEGSSIRSVVSGLNIYLHFHLMDHVWWL